MDQVEIGSKNFYKEGDRTHSNLSVNDWYLPEMWDEILINTDFENSRKKFDDFNAENKWKKRGIAVIPTKYFLGYGPAHQFLGQGTALVNIYLDGTILLNHGGVEMGQGLHVKMIQIAADTLKVPVEQIYIAETATDKVPNASQTAASLSSDILGLAVMDACEQLKKRIEPYKDKSPSGTFKDCVVAAYMDRVCLSAVGYGKLPEVNYNFETNCGEMYHYHTSGVAVSMVELDVLTGDHVVLRTDIIMDIGNSLNYGIDIGQIEGAFIQGLGWCTLEETLVFSSNGAVARGPGSYKIPTFRSIPQEFNVKVLRDKEYKHLKTVKSSKGIGEPPLFLAASVFLH